MSTQLNLFAPPTRPPVSRRSAFGQTLRVLTANHPQAAPGSVVRGHWNTHLQRWMTTAGPFEASDVQELTPAEIVAYCAEPRTQEEQI